MRPFSKAFVITLGVVQVVALLILWTNHSNLAGYSNAGETFGIVNFLGGLLCLFVGLVCTVPVKWRETGKGILFAGLATIVLGTALCSQYLKL